MTLAASGIRYSSKDHEWEWEFRDVRLLEQDGRRALNLETHARETASARVGRVLGIGTPDRYNFELAAAIRDEDWARFERLTR